MYFIVLIVQIFFNTCLSPDVSERLSVLSTSKKEYCLDDFIFSSIGFQNILSRLKVIKTPRKNKIIFYLVVKHHCCQKAQKTSYSSHI